MIVRDEEPILTRCLRSFLEADLVDTWTICDTGSTDGTRELVKYLLRSKPGRLYRHTWRSFGHNRTLALRRARGSADWLLVVDADYVLRFVNDGLREWLAGAGAIAVDAWQVSVFDHGLEYRVPRLVRGDAELRYVGATHEALEVPNAMNIVGLQLEHVGDGASTAVKLELDLELLRPALEAGDPRATFYTAETLRYLGLHGPAQAMYGKRARQNGWAEERWYASYQAARLGRDVEALIECWRERPWRHEPLTAAAALVGSDLRVTGDSLFLEPAPQPL
jgi:glycosyltransferase involved in cell wall biosynthesis